MAALPRPPAKDMCWVPGGEFAMGSQDFYPEERPVHRVAVDGFWMDEHPVTVAEFRRFVKATGHVTVAETAPDPAEFPDAEPAQLVPGSLVFHAPPGPVPLDDVQRWWHWVPGADWRHPYGPGSTLDGLDRHPVTHVAYDDAAAFAAWSGKVLATEAEWEFAARGGLDGATFAWGDEITPTGRPMANTWEGRFPWENLRLDGYDATSPIRTYPPNGFGLSDMTGNVWEWTDDFYTAHDGGEPAHPCCVPRNPRRSTPDWTVGEGAPGAQQARRVIKGGSHLCAPNYCLRYRPAARQAETVDTSTCHIGFRCIIRGH
jgi:sulfatase modifying factor 1